MRFFPFFSIPLFTFFSCGTMKKTTRANASAIELFKTYITGDFDNKNQVEAEKKQGKQIHPFATHINRIADGKIKNAPARNGFWIIEESYYVNPDHTQKINHHLFFFEGADDKTVRLYAYELPASLPMEQLTNDNKNLSIDFNALRVSPRFKPADYNMDGEKFSIFAPNDLGNGLKFTLIETFVPGRLEVMELLEKDGKRLTAYETPIVYERRR
jgi:hypothetical protein